MNLQETTNKVVDLAKEVGEFIRTERKTFNYNNVEIKGLNDLVSYVDKTSEQKFIKNFLSFFPKAGFIVEENTKWELKIIIGLLILWTEPQILFTESLPSQ